MQTLAFTPDRCPKCGCPPHEFTVVTKVFVGLDYQLDGHEFTPDPRKVRLPKEMKGEVELCCGGGHTWTATIKTEEG